MGSLGDPWEALGGSLGFPGVSLGGPWGALGSLGGPWGALGAPWGVLGAPREVPGGSLGGPGGAQSAQKLCLPMFAEGPRFPGIIGNHRESSEIIGNHRESSEVDRAIDSAKAPELSKQLCID